MTDHTALEVANAFLRLQGGYIPRMKLQKLVYLAQGWHLAITGQPLISEQPEAWDNGPVFRSLYDHIRDWGYNFKEWALAHPFTETLIKPNLVQTESAIVDRVWKQYGHMSGTQLSDLTHQDGTPWTNAYMQSGRNARIDFEAIRQHFVDLAIASRPNANRSQP